MADVIGFDPVAYSIDGGRHPADLLRIVSYAATAGSEGIVSLNDCKVSQLSVAGTQVRIGTGGVVIRNRSAGVVNQTYVANARVETRLDVQATGASGRSDLVIVRIEDPQYSPWATPPAGQAPTYQYTKPIIIQNVAASTDDARDLNLGYSAYALARIDIPANTGTITNAMIKDLRKVAVPRRQREVRVFHPTATIDRGTTTQRVLFPDMAQLVPCPEWASEVKAIVTVGNLAHLGDVTGHMRVEYGWNGVDPYLFTQDSGIHHTDTANTGEITRMSIPIAGEMKIPANFRGLEHFVRIGTEINPSTGIVKSDKWVTIVVDLEFVEIAD